MDRIRRFPPDPAFPERSSSRTLQLMSNEMLQRELDKARNVLDLITLELSRRMEMIMITPPPPPAKKSSMEEWVCSCCQVSCTCWQNFEQHISCRKHKAKEAALRARESSAIVCPDCKFWCAACGIGTNSLGVMVNHKYGKNHSSRTQGHVSAKYYYLA